MQAHGKGACSDTGDASADVLSPNTGHNTKQPCKSTGRTKANTGVLTYRTWVDDIFKVVNEENHVEISCKVPASELFQHLKNQNISSLGFMGEKKKVRFEKRAKFHTSAPFGAHSNSLWLFSPSSSEDHCS